jgi:hypothetical protein
VANSRKNASGVEESEKTGDTIAPGESEDESSANTATGVGTLGGNTGGGGNTASGTLALNANNARNGYLATQVVSHARQQVRRN